MNEIQTTKVCLGPCKRDLPLDMYNLHAGGRLGRQPRCKDCKRVENREIAKRFPDKAAVAIKKWRAEHPELVREYARNHARKPSAKSRTWKCALRREYGITPDDYFALLVAQDSKCAICQTPSEEDKKLHVDHCHNSKQVRGLLCGKCNRGIGMFMDNTELLYRAIDYLHEF